MAPRVSREATTDGERTSSERESSSAASDGGRTQTDGHACNVAFCPIGLALSAVQPIRPEAVERLLVAGREFFLAMKAIVDARAEQFEDEGYSGGLEKIDIG